MDRTLNLKVGVIATRVYTLFKIAKLTRNYNKILDNIESLKKYIITSIPIIRKIIPSSPKTTSDAEIILKRALYFMNSKYDAAGTYSDLKQIFRETYLFLGKTLVVLNSVAGVAGGIGASIAAGVAGTTAKGPGGAFLFTSPFIAIPITVCAVLAVFTNAKKHGITYRESLTNFKVSFKEFLRKQALTKKEKHLAFIPYILISLAIFLFRFPFSQAAKMGMMSMVGGGKGAEKIWTLKTGIIQNTAPGLGIDASKFKASMLTKDNVKIALIAFVCVTILYLTITVLEQWVMRKGEIGSSDEV